MADGSITISITGDAKDLEKELKKVNERIKQTGNESEKTGKQGSKLGGMISAGCKVAGAAIAAVGTATGGIAAAVYKVGSSFESEMSKVQAISGASGDEVQKLTDKAKEMGAKTKFSATESAQAMEYMAMAGWKTSDMLNGLDGIMNLAAASGEDLGTTSDIVTDALTAFGMVASDSGRFADVLAAASSNANTNVSMMGETFKYVAPVAGALGYSVEDTAVAIGLMANAGIKGSQAGTALRGMLTNLAKPSDTVAKYMDDLGISMTNSAGEVKPLNELLGDMREKFAELTEAQKAEYAAGIAGQEGMSGLLAIVDASDADFTKLTDSINNSNGAAQQMADTMNDNLQGAITILKSNLEGIGLKIYEAFGPAAKDAVQQISDVLSGDEMSGAIDRFAEALANAATAIGNFISGVLPSLITGLTWVLNHASEIAAGIAAIGSALAVIKIGSGIVKVIGIIKSIGSIAPVIGAAISAIGGPITLIIAAIAAVATGIAVLWNTNEGFRNAVTSIWSAITSAISSAVTGICNFFTQTIPSALNSLAAFFSGIWNGITNIVSSAWNTICNAVQVAIMLVAEIINAAIQIIAIPFQFIWQNCQTVIVSAWEAIQAVVSNALNAISGIISSVWSAVSAFLIPILEGIRSTFSNVWNSVSSIVSSVVNTISGVISGVFNAVKNTITNILNGINTTFSSIWNGIKSAVTTVVGNIKTAITKPIDQAKSTVTSTLDAIKKAFSDKMDAAREAVKTAIDKIKGFFNFSWKLPSLKLPHISISGGFSLNPPSVPHFSISWYKRAMGGAMLLDDATIFGMSGGRMLGGGESGHEYIVGQNLLKRDIKSSVSEALRNARLSLVIDTHTAAANASTAYTTNNVYSSGGKTSVTYNQTINSPKAMSRREVRRETKNVVKELKAYA